MMMVKMIMIKMIMMMMMKTPIVMVIVHVFEQNHSVNGDC